MEYKSENRICQNCKNDFTIEVEDFKFYEKIKVPPPTFCPECRFIRRFVWRNEGSFYKKKCDLCNKDVITINSPNNKFPIYCHDCWWGDNWDPMKYGRDYDFNKSFFEQYKELMNVVPALNLWAFGNTRSDYSNYTGYSKNSYLSNAVYCENVFYSKSIEKSKDCIDCYMVVDSELCYESFNTTKSFSSSFLSECRDCISSYFLFDCYNCQNCFMCSGLRNKNFCIRNKEYSREEYLEKIESYNLSLNSSINKFKKEFDELMKKSVRRFASIFKSIDSDGDYVKNSKNVHKSFIVEGENLKYCWRATEGIKDSYDVCGCVSNELIYEASIVADTSFLCRFYNHSKNMSDSSLFQLCGFSSNLFGCIGMKNKSYCILNKQYGKEEYEELVPKIIKHMNDMPYIDSKGRIYRYGEFFPSELSPFCYNETIAQEYFPLTKEEAEEQGYKWKEREERNYNIDIYSKDIPNDIKEVDDTIINKVIECEHKGTCNEQCTEAFKIIGDELSFYKRMNIPIPHLCPNCRHYNRLKQ
ncbi:MAG: hypothetical protein WCS86_03605, partial [Candidatus Paceibacterota bacterium]